MESILTRAPDVLTHWRQDWRDLSPLAQQALHASLPLRERDDARQRLIALQDYCGDLEAMQRAYAAQGTSDGFRLAAMAGVARAVCVSVRDGRWPSDEDSQAAHRLCDVLETPQWRQWAGVPPYDPSPEVIRQRRRLRARAHSRPRWVLKGWGAWVVIAVGVLAASGLALLALSLSTLTPQSPHTITTIAESVADTYQRTRAYPSAQEIERVAAGRTLSITQPDVAPTEDGVIGIWTDSQGTRVLLTEREDGILRWVYLHDGNQDAGAGRLPDITP